MMKVGILNICTGKYSVLWKGFYETFERYFLPNCEKHYFVFTDEKNLEYENNNPRIHKHFEESQPWPFPTLYRFKTFLTIEEDLEKMDYLFFFNADAEVVKDVTEDMILPRKEKGEYLVVARHSGYYKTSVVDFTYDRNPKCKAYIPYGEGEIYVSGAANGGTADAYLKMCHILAQRIDEDYQKGIIALWHDESHLNKYITEYKNYRLLTPSFVHPTQDWWPEIPYESIIQLRDKTKYFDVDSFKANALKTKIPWSSRAYNRILYHFKKKKIKKP